MSLGILVGRFGSLVEEVAPAEPVSVSVEFFPDALVRVRDQFGHHLVPLLLLSRADGDTVEPERLVILQHCVDRAERGGAPLSDEEKAVLADYLFEFTPSRIQLAPALKRLEAETKDAIAALLAAAQAVIDADGERREREQRVLAQLSRDLAQL